MPPFWRRATRDPSVKSYLTSSVVSTKSGSVENSSDIGIEKQEGIQRRDWYSPGERYEPEDRNLRFGTHDFCYEFIEVSCCQNDEGLPTASSVIGVIGKKRDCGEWSGSEKANQHIEGPELKIWLEKEFVWSHKHVETIRDKSSIRSTTRSAKKHTSISRPTSQGVSVNGAISQTSPVEAEKESLQGGDQHVPNSGGLKSASWETIPDDENMNPSTPPRNAISQNPPQPKPSVEISSNLATAKTPDKVPEVVVTSTTIPAYAHSDFIYGPRVRTDDITFEDPDRSKPILRGTRIILIDCYEPDHTQPDINLEFTELEYKYLQQALGFSHREMVVTLMYSHGQASHRSAKNTKGEAVKTFMFKLGIQTTGYYTVIISYNLVTHTTYVAILAQTRKDGFSTIKSWFENVSSWKLEPFAIIRILVDGILSLSHHSIETQDFRLSVLQSIMGQHTYREKERGDPLKMDFTWATRVLNHASTILAMNKMRVLGAQKALQKSKVFMEMIKTSSEGNGKEREPLLGDEDDVSAGDLHDLLEALGDRCEHLLDRIEYEQQRVQTQLAAVYTFMAAKDNIVNIGLAADSKEIAASSKKDSSAMKTIAVLTMMFLPATFVAALFAMPVLDFSVQDGGSVFKPSFKYYWAVTIPLTFVLILVWSLVLLLPWKRWLPWRDLTMNPDSESLRNRRALGSFMDNDSSRSLVDD